MTILKMSKRNAPVLEFTVLFCEKVGCWLPFLVMGGTVSD